MNVRTAHIVAIRPFMSSSRPKATLRGRPESPTDATTAGGRLRALRKGVDMNQDVLAGHLGVTRPHISKYETGVNAIPDHLVERAARLFSVTATFIRYGDAETRLAQVIGRVGAGAMVEAVQGPPWRYVEVQVSWTDAVALQIAGNSGYPIYDDGDDIIIRGEHRLEEDEFLNRMCVVETAEGMGLLKRVRRGSRPGLYTLESPNAPPIEDIELTSARPVRAHLPR